MLVSYLEYFKASTDFILFSEKLTILSVVIAFKGDKSSIELRLRLITIRFVHYKRHYKDPIAWFGKLIVNIT
jgi:hypothetical protein